MPDKLIIFTDGGARGNPGPAAIGAVIKDESGKLLAEVSEYIGETTNNQAEYRAVIAALVAAKKFQATDIDFFLDSELVVKQLIGKYRVKHPELAPLYVKICNEKMPYRKVSFTHIRRELNKEADALVNKALDSR